MKIHTLKTHPPYFQDILDGNKTFEARYNDRDFKTGDSLLLQEWTPCRRCGGSGRIWDNGDKQHCGCRHGEYSGRDFVVKVTYILEGEEFGIRKGFCVMGIKK